MNRCQRKGCTNEATLLPSMKFYADRDSLPATSVAQLPTCQQCADKIDLDDLITDEGWEMVVQAFRRVGRVDPVRSLTEVGFVEIIT